MKSFDAEREVEWKEGEKERNEKDIENGNNVNLKQKLVTMK